jgi:nucleoside-triphosphatase|tara:strand:+ start:3306 stop:3866 length:561 start_codon:yes stop_codon:yes gene_type:complete
MSKPSNCVWLITGKPGIGKTTCLSRIIYRIKSDGYTVGGVMTRELRVQGERTGFELIDIRTGENGILSSTTFDAGPKLGRYRINLQFLSKVGSKSLLSSNQLSNLTICDEIGPMEMFSPDFRCAIDYIINSGKPVLGGIHQRLNDPLIQQIRSSKFVKIYEVTLQNREEIPNILANEILKLLESKN